MCWIYKKDSIGVSVSYTHLDVYKRQTAVLPCCFTPRLCLRITKCNVRQRWRARGREELLLLCNLEAYNAKSRTIAVHHKYNSGYSRNAIKGQHQGQFFFLGLKWSMFLNKICLLLYFDCRHEYGTVYTPVSYTHLDVYKRQPVMLSDWLKRQ